MIGRRSIGAIAACFLLAGCAVVQGPPPETYDLTAPRDFSGKVGGTRAQLLIANPSSVSVLDSERIVVRPDPYVVTYLKGAQWTDKLPKLLQTRIVQAFENTGNVRAVGRPGEGLLIDYQVVLDIRNFEIDSSSGTAQVLISAKIMNDRNGRVLASQQIGGQASINGGGNDEMVAALDSASQAAIDQLVRWTLAKI
ncbi:MAG: ABC-type transport auxiliary lipoprotein family protein [Tepidamorphaceae bacterium]|nr:membrane integrity-associated transporter subunit PqiC [Rhodobiaceae bacterium]MCC0050000.1 membrane integrity-associated transporter subunit PqiC [Rhodobiaceae bacterium]